MATNHCRYTWRNKLARIENQKRTGNLFAFKGPLVSNPDGPMRGGMYPRITDIAGGDAPPEQVNAGPTLLNANYHPNLSSQNSSGRDEHEAKRHM